MARGLRIGHFGGGGQPEAPTSGLTTFTVTSANAGQQPFTVGHAFKQGDIPSGQTLTGLQCSIKTTWPDGSAKFVVVSGYATLTSNVARTVGCQVGTAPSGANVATSALAAVTASIGYASDTASFGSGDWGSPFETVTSGPLMSSWKYRKPIGADAHLVAWLEVRAYSSGAVEVLPWVENGFLTGTSPGNKSGTYTFSLGGSQRFSSAIDVKARTRIPLLSGAGVFSYWVGSDPAVSPAHSAAYLMSTGMVPYYGWGAPTDATLNALPTGYTANTRAGVAFEMSDAGNSAALIPTYGVLYLTSGGDVRAWRSAMVYGFSGGSWGTHYRDASTHHVPSLADIPSATFNGTSTPTIPANSGTTNGTPATTHQPSFGYLPALLSGWNWFFEESAFWSVWNYLNPRVNSRRGETSYESSPFRNANGSAGVIDPRTGDYSNRGAHWSIRTLAQTLALCPSSHPTHASWVAAWEANTDFYKAIFVDGTFAPGWVSPQGILGEYSSDSDSLYGPFGADTSWHGAGWMNSFGVQSWGFASDLGLPQSSASQTRHAAARDHAYKQVVQRADDGLSGRYNWRRFMVYSYPIGTDAVGMPMDTWYTAAESYSHYLTAHSLASIPSTFGLTLKQHSSDTDLTSADTTSSDYGAFATAALAYAAKHSASGAAAAWNRVSGASNFRASFAPVFEADPEHGVLPHDGTVLAGAAARLKPGQCIRLTTNITGTQLSPEGSDVLQWGVSAYFDPVRKEVGFIGKRDGPNPYHWVTYDLANNSWAIDARALWSSANASGHGYDHNTCDPETGDVYHIPFGANAARKWNGTSWSTTASWTQNTNATGGLTYFPGLGLFYNDGIAGLLRLNGSTWDTVYSITGLEYHDFSEYNAAADVLIFGGGNNTPYYKCTRGLTVTQIANAPFRISANAGDQGIIASDPNSDNLIARDVDTGAWAQYDISANAWTTLTQSTGDGSAPQTGTPNLANVNGSEVCCSLPPYGVTIWLQFRSGSNTLDAWLYRHT